MKKLMIVAAVAAMTGLSFGAACDRGTVDNSGGANVYQLQMQLKSTWGLPCGGGVNASLCGRDTTNVFSVLRTPASFVINAWLYTCTNACYTLKGSSVIAWEQNRKELFSGTAITWSLLNIIGVSADQAEAEFDFTGKIADYSNGASSTALPATWNIKCAGQGTFGKNETVPKYMFLSGYCAGDVSASYYIQGKICEASKVLTCEKSTYSETSLTVCPTEVEKSAVFGRWALRYNTEASVQYFTDGTVNIPHDIWDSVNKKFAFSADKKIK